LRYSEKVNLERVEKMKAVAINSSPSMGEGNTALVLDPFLQGMREVGAEVELFSTKKLKITLPGRAQLLA